MSKGGGACAFCKRSKKKCDGGTPSCSSCSHYGLPCFYPSVFVLSDDSSSSSSSSSPSSSPSSFGGKGGERGRKKKREREEGERGERREGLGGEREGKKEGREEMVFRARGESEGVAKRNFSSSLVREGREEEEGRGSLRRERREEEGEERGSSSLGLPKTNQHCPPTKKVKTEKTLEWCTLAEQQLFLSQMGELHIEEQVDTMVKTSLLVDRQRACDLSRLIAIVENLGQPGSIFRSPFKKSGKRITYERKKKEILWNKWSFDLLWDPENTKTSLLLRCHHQTQLTILNTLKRYYFSWDRVFNEMYVPMKISFGNSWRTFFCHFKFFYDRTGFGKYVVAHFPNTFPLRKTLPTFTFLPIQHVNSGRLPSSIPSQIVIYFEDEDYQSDNALALGADCHLETPQKGGSWAKVQYGESCIVEYVGHDEGFIQDAGLEETIQKSQRTTEQRYFVEWVDSLIEEETQPLYSVPQNLTLQTHLPSHSLVSISSPSIQIPPVEESRLFTPKRYSSFPPQHNLPSHDLRSAGAPLFSSSQQERFPFPVNGGSPNANGESPLLNGEFSFNGTFFSPSSYKSSPSPPLPTWENCKSSNYESLTSFIHPQEPQTAPPPQNIFSSSPHASPPVHSPASELSSTWEESSFFLHQKSEPSPSSASLSSPLLVDHNTPSPQSLSPPSQTTNPTAHSPTHQEPNSFFSKVTETTTITTTTSCPTIENVTSEVFDKPPPSTWRESTPFSELSPLFALDTGNFEIPPFPIEDDEFFFPLDFFDQL